MFPLAEHRGLLLYGLAASLLTFLIGGYSSSLVLFVLWLRILTSVQSRAFILVMLPIPLILWHWSTSRRHLIKPRNPSPIANPGPLRPLIFPCRTTHTRLFPKKHHLIYNYLQVGIPVGWQQSSSILGMDDSRQTPWFSIGAADHLARGQEGSSLDDKLAAYLSSQGESLKDYPHSYLVTAPRFLGYVFSPVSFWFLFSSNLRLEAMILEVNNTFDERRMYFMKRGIDTDIDAMGEEAKFAHTWPKDFHVSPFNSRKGDYSLAAINPFTSTNPKIDNVITLKSSKGHTKIIARLFSTDPAIDPAHMGDLETIRLVSSWFWTGFLTFPRILKEAAILFFKHKLHVWYRPEVAKTSIGRRPTNRERLVESIFQSFLHEQVRLSPTPTSLTCIPPTGSTTDTLHFTSSSSSTNKQTPPRKSLTLQILTPQFYTDIATSSIPADYISASTNQPSELQTFATTSHQDLARLLTTPAAAKSSTRIRITTSVRAYILSALRRRRRRRRQKSKRAASHVLDEWVLLHGDTLSDQQRDAYFKCATALVIAGRGLAGFDVVLDWMVQAMQIGLVWLGTGFILGLRHNI